MSFTKSFLIECSRQNAENVKITQRNTGIENASWVNRQSFNFQVGDKVSTENVIIHSIGASADSTVELTGENEESTGLADNVLGVEFSNYVCDNGYNTIHLPMFVPNTIGPPPYIGFVPDANGGHNTYNDEQDGQDLPGQATAIVQGFIVNNYEVEADYGSPICTDISWKFKCSVLADAQGVEAPVYVDGHIGGFPQVARTSFGLKLYENDENYNHSVTGKKYTKLGLDYCGPYRRNGYVDESNASFYDGHGDDIPIFTTSIIVEIDAPIYESPSTICNKINETFHETLPLNETPKTGIMPRSVEGNILPHTAGPLNTIIRANGDAYINTDDSTPDRVYQNKLWGNIAVEDINKWKGIQAMMRCTLAFSGKIHYYGSPNQYFFPRPVIYIDGLGYRQNFKFRQQDAVQQNQVKSFFPRKLFEFKSDCRDERTQAGHNNISRSIAYSIVPKYFVISTNIQYTSRNVARIKKWFDATKQYQGNFSDVDAINADTQNWFVYSDIGSSMDGVNTKDSPAPFDFSTGNRDGEVYSYGKYSAVPADQERGVFYAPSTGLCSQIRKGRFNVREDITQPNNYPGQQNYAGAIAMNPYKVHLKVGDTYDFSCSPRSDFPEGGYTYYEYGEPTVDGLPSVNTPYSITSIPTDAPIRFKNNEQKDASMKLFANQLDDITKMRFTNARGGSIDNENGVEGFGEWRRNGTINPETDMDTSLSDGYGVYGCNIIDDDAVGDVYYEIEDIYMTGLYHNFPNEDANTFRSYEFLFHWTPGTSDVGHTQATNGGLDVMYWDDSQLKWFKSNDFYIYSVKNNNYKHASHNPNNYTYNGGEAIPTNNPLVFWFWKDGHNLGFVAELTRFSSSGTGYNAFTFTPIDNVSEAEIVDSVFGQKNSLDNTQVVRTLIVQTDERSGPYELFPTPGQSFYSDVKLNNKFPTEIHESSEKCCCFVVAEDSASFDGTNWNPKNPCALPNIYHGCPFGPSPSFMDSPAIFMINQQRNDGNADPPNDPSQLQNYMMIGANDPTCQFDSALSRAKFFNFHTQRVLGAREMPFETDGQGNITITKETLGNFVIKIADNTMYYPNINQWTETYNAVVPQNSTAAWKNAHANKGLSTSVCGISVENIYSQPKGVIKTDILDMSKLTEDTFYNSLLYKLGFTFKQFFPDFGLPYNWFDPAVQGRNDPINIYKSSKPLSTNAALTISDSANLAIQDNTPVAPYGDSTKDVPTYQLGFAGGVGVSLDGTDSQAIIASNLPIKMDDAFYQIYSDIVPTTYKSENQDLNIISTCMKNYIEGDYIYGFASTYDTTVEFPLKISEITTEVRLPNGNLAPIDQKSSVIYKVERQMTMPDINQILLDLKKNAKKDAKNNNQ